jgi:hypothetical protein
VGSIDKTEDSFKKKEPIENIFESDYFLRTVL